MYTNYRVLVKSSPFWFRLVRVRAFEDIFGTMIPDEEVTGILTVGQAVKIVKKLIL
jgi:hypothetical protein